MRNGLCVLDFDNPGAFFSWKKEAGNLVESYTVRSRRGWHVYFWLDEPFKAIARIEKGGEIRGKGIMVVPPSVHKSGANYMVWVDLPIMRVQSVESLSIEWQMIEKERPEIVPYGESFFDGDGLIARIKNGIGISLYLSRITKVFWNGVSWVAVCPFHNDHDPSLQIHPEEGWCYCHSPGCKAHMRCDVIRVAELLWGCSQKEVIRLLAQELD